MLCWIRAPARERPCFLSLRFCNRRWVSHRNSEVSPLCCNNADPVCATAFVSVNQAHSDSTAALLNASIGARCRAAHLLCYCNSDPARVWCDEEVMKAMLSEHRRRQTDCEFRKALTSPIFGELAACWTHAPGVPRICVRNEELNPILILCKWVLCHVSGATAPAQTTNIPKTNTAGAATLLLPQRQIPLHLD